MAAGPGFLFLDEDGSVREMAQPEAGRTDVRMNDGARESQGRFWAGTMAYDESPGAGTLYRLELDGSCTTVLTGLTIANGIGWSRDGSTMYLNDSGTGCVDTFRFDSDSGAITDRRTLVHSYQPGVVPDGLTVDEDDGIWVALWAAAPSTATRPTEPSSPALSCPSSDPPRARSAAPTGRHRSSPPLARGSTTTHSPGNPTVGERSRSTASAYAGSRANPTAAEPPRPASTQ